MDALNFRVWDKANKQWLSGADIVSSGMFHTTGRTSASISIARRDDVVFVRPTGLKDKNGVGIYEGDIITTKFHGTYVDRVAWDGPPDATAEVYWDYCSFNLRARGEKDERFATFEDLADYVDWKHLQYLHMATEHTEVIGNIYENPELLK